MRKRNRPQLALLLTLSLVAFLSISSTGCARKSSGPVVDLRQSDIIRNGSLILGSPSLTSGIPGDGPLTQQEIEAWLEDDENHQVLTVALPDHLSAAEIHIPSDNPLTRAKIELGRQLFFDKRLSGFGSFSCADCHQPKQYFTSFQVMPEVERNVSTIFNRGLGDHHFWDGRAESLEIQPLSPIKNPFEMNSSPEQTSDQVKNIAGYRVQFERIFASVSFEHICQAIACFERCLVTSASAWDRKQLSESAKRGEALFFGDRAGCVECHPPPNFTDEAFHNLGAHLLAHPNDEGRLKVTKDPADRNKFKTPSLRNAAATPPYMHNGAIKSLRDAVEFFNQGGSGETVLPQLFLTDAEKSDLVEFLKSLTSELPPVAEGRLPE